MTTRSQRVGWYWHVMLALRTADLDRPHPKKESGNEQSGRLQAGARLGGGCGAWSCVCRAGCGGSRPGHTGTAVTSG